MNTETLLPLEKLDLGWQAPERGLGYGFIDSDSQLLDQLAYYSILMEETRVDPLQIWSLAETQTTWVKPGTLVAIGFAGSPSILVESAWTIHRISGGRFECA